MKKRLFALIVAAVMVLLLTSYASAAKDYTPDVKMKVFPNGLTLMVVERPQWPTVTCIRYHKVGSVNEYPGMTGAAHLLEHMMFKGTKNLGTWNYKAEKPIMEKIDRIVDEIDKERAKGLTAYHKPDKKKIRRLWQKVKKLQQEQKKYIRKNEISYIYKTQGGAGLNAYTSFDETVYYVNLPANKLKVWAYIEADRMKNPVFREFYSERDVVYEERRMYANRPSGALFEVFMNNFFVTSPYGHNIVGWASDIESMRRNKVLGFLKKYYAPNNTILVLVGDVKFDDAVKTIGKYFEEIPRQKDPLPVFTQDPPQKGERRADLQFRARPRLIIGYHGPKPGHPDQYALDVLGYILSQGRNSRLYKNLVKKKIAYTVSGGNWTWGYVNVFVVSGSPKSPHDNDKLEDAIYEEIERFKTEPVTERELQAVRNKVEKAYIRHLKSNFSLGVALAEYYYQTGDWRNFDEREKIRAVTPEDIMRVAKKYLVERNRTVARIVPVESPKKGGGK